MLLLFFVFFFFQSSLIIFTKLQRISILLKLTVSLTVPDYRWRRGCVGGGVVRCSGQSPERMKAAIFLFIYQTNKKKKVLERSALATLQGSGSESLQESWCARLWHKEGDWRKPSGGSVAELGTHVHLWLEALRVASQNIYRQQAEHTEMIPSWDNWCVTVMMVQMTGVNKGEGVSV